MVEIVKFPTPPQPESCNDILDDARDRLEHVFVLGWDNDGELYWKTTLDGPAANWLLDQVKRDLLEPTVGVELDV